MGWEGCFNASASEGVFRDLEGKVILEWLDNSIETVDLPFNDNKA